MRATLTVHIQNLAGAVHTIDGLAADATVADVKRRLHAVDADCAVERTRLMLMRDTAVENHSDACSHTLLVDNARTLMSYGVTNEAILHSLVVIHECGEHLRTYPPPQDGDAGTVGDANRALAAVSAAYSLRSPYGVCANDVSDELFVADTYGKRVLVLRTSDGSLLREYACMGAPRFLCVLPGADELFYADSDSSSGVHVLRASDGSHLRAYGAEHDLRDAWGVCLNELADELIVADTRLSRVVVLRASDGTHLRTYTNDGRTGVDCISDPRGVCLSPATDELFVACNGNGSVLVLRASDGMHLRSYRHDFHWLNCVCVLPAVDELLVTHNGSKRVIVLRASTGALLRSYDAESVNGFAPSGVCVAANGELFCTDFSRNRIEVFWM